MAFERSKDVSFFTEIINVAVDEILKAQKPKSKTSNTNDRKPRNSLQKENTGDTKKTTQEPRKSVRKPLGTLNEIKPARKSVSLSTEKSGPPKRKSTANAGLPSSQPKAEKKEKANIPKIIVYEDPTDKTKVQEKGSNRKSARGLSKSWDGSVTNNRRSYAKGDKNPRLAVSKTKNVRRSLNDLSNIKALNKTEKSPKRVEERKKSPAESRLTKFKPEQPEFEESLAKLETLFPNVDPEFMKIQFLNFKGSLSETIEFIITKEKTNELPTRADYLRKLEMEKLQKKFMDNFSVVDFLKMIPDPWEHFLKTEKHNCASYAGHSLHYLKNKYKKYYMKDIQEALAKNEYSLYLADKQLKKKSRSLKMRATNRSNNECDAGKPTTFNMQFVQEMAFVENENKIKSHIKKDTTARYKKFKEAEEAGTLLECQSCNDFSLLQDDVVNCPANHVFCKDCVVKYVEIEMGKDNFQFKCLLKCEEKFSLESLQAVLSPPVMGKIIQRNQLEEIKAAGINDLAYCPFCYYVIIMPPEIRVFRCLNPSCMMESCRHCKKLNHIPLKCNELEKFDETVLIEFEEKEEEEGKEYNFSLSKCTDCGGKFLKREDSNQMVCACGATMWSICQQPHQECQHFNTKRQNKSPNRLSFSSSDYDTETDEVPAEYDVERSSNCSDTLLAMFLSESENF